MSSDHHDKKWHTIHRSKFSQSKVNTLKQSMDELKKETNPAKPLIPLSIGDPTVSSDLKKPDNVREMMDAIIGNKQFDAYTPSCGTERAREAIARYYSKLPGLVYKTQDIIITHGCSHAMDLLFAVIGNAGENVLVPCPCFPSYESSAAPYGIQIRHYNLIPEQDWIIDLEHLKSKINEKTVAIVYNNPSNPCGSVYSKEHLIDLLNVAADYELPIIADEIYGDMTLYNSKFYYLSELSHKVPIFSCNAISKRFILPGWSLGWIAIHDPENVCQEIRKGLADLDARIPGPNSLVQAFLPELLEKTPLSYHDHTMAIIQENADLFHNKLSQLPGIRVLKPFGGLFMMIQIDFNCFPQIKDDHDFALNLVREQSVLCTPASMFQLPNYIRIVLTIQKEKSIEACNRIKEFIEKHYVKLQS